ncbi:MAG: EI24 domain-containing protein [Alphaproteobacteria bacterium]|nr:EI24 domain-containing protein [Alphaproteobacteria bacterium]
MGTTHYLWRMFSSLFKAMNDVTSPEFRKVLWTSVGLTVALFAAILVGVETVLSFITLVPWPWLQTTIALGTGLGLLAAFFFLAGPAVAMFAGLFLDKIAARVEQRHYPKDQPGKSLPTIPSFFFGLKFAATALLANLIVLPLVFVFGFGIVLLVVVNAYLISREYFEMAATRFMSPQAASALRKQNGGTIFIAGFIPALMSLVPVLNLTVPLFATSYFVHIFKKVSASSV